MQQYDADFSSADPANLPQDGSLFVSLPPIVWFAIIVIIGAVFLLGWFMSARRGSRKGDAGLSIWKDIDDAAKAAMKADGDALPGKAAALQRTIESRLGRTLALAGGLAGNLKALSLALEGRPADAHGHDDHGHEDHAHDEAHDDGHGDRATPGPAGSVSGASASVTINVPGSVGHTPPHTSHHLSAAERNRALRNAVADINEHWRHRSLRLTEMSDALAELTGDASGGRSGDWRQSR